MKYHLTIKELPPDSRPRERLIEQGAENLATAELLAIILRTGSRGYTALQVAQQLLVAGGENGSLRYLATADINELSSFPGMGPAKAAQIKAALELGKRLVQEEPGRGDFVRSPEDAYFLVKNDMRYLDREHFCTIMLNTKNQVLFQETVAVGSLSAALIHPRELFKNCIRKSAAAIILVHNHPSGDPEPSPEDIKLTGRLVQAGALLGIQVLDHIIVGDGCYVSLRERGLIQAAVHPGVKSGED
ncbi:MAG: DNA repair protein RadC [Firmicutes bacterium]|jgi:DNA repair protein RadC|nr:DNA repair protein RadC [Bacillota bacterium]